VELKPRAEAKIRALIEKGVSIPNPLTLDIGDEVDINTISADGVVLYPGTRLYGSRTVISAGTVLGREGTVTIDNCQIGPKVDLKAGSFSKSVFLESSNMGPGAHVREACILEEEAGGAHCVGLKQTILFPFVTLGSLINFCDCFMAGGTSRRDHSEVGSSYIHFNFTPDGNKTTPSLIGDVPRGVLLDQKAIFLGGQGGMVGPLQIGYGTTVAAGSVLRKDVPAEDKLIIPGSPPAGVLDYGRNSTSGTARIIGHNFTYLANLCALEEWYRHVRRHFFATQEFGQLVYEGALEKLVMAKKERIKRLQALVEKLAPGRHPACTCETGASSDCELHGAVKQACAVFMQPCDEKALDASRLTFLTAFEQHAGGHGDYITSVQTMPADARMFARTWLTDIVEAYSAHAATLLPSLRLFRKKTAA
jgi:bifunctional UDP-N-acetylglucosamine pyrophosphorylase / glucosamine-1-phosphate N-acetyltransferase